MPQTPTDNTSAPSGSPENLQNLLFGELEPEPEPAPVEVVEVIEPDPIQAMRHYVEALDALGAANKQGGFQIIARGMGSAASYEKALGWAKGDTDDLQGAVDFLDGSDMSERTVAQREYFSAMRALATHKLDKEDLITMQVGFMKFRNRYGTPGEGKKARGRVRTQLRKAINDSQPSVPAEMFYHPDITIYASSVLSAKDRPSWEDVVGRIGGFGGESEEIAPAEISALLSDLNRQGSTSLLTDGEAKLLAPTKARLNQIYRAIRHNKGLKLHRKAIDGSASNKRQPPPVDFGVAVERAVKGVSDTLDERSKKAEVRLQQLTLQADVLDRLGACSSEFPDRPFEITSDTVAYIVGEIVPDIASVIARNQLFDEDMKKNAEYALTRALFSKDRMAANETAKTLFWILQDRARIMGESTVEMKKLKEGFGHSALSNTKAKE